jgi:hypothetical protein
MHMCVQIVDDVLASEMIVCLLDAVSIGFLLFLFKICKLDMGFWLSVIGQHNNYEYIVCLISCAGCGEE